MRSAVRFAEIAAFRNGLNFGDAESGWPTKVLGIPDFWQRAELRDFSGAAVVPLASKLSAEDCLRDGDLVFVRSNGSKTLVGRCLLVYPGAEIIGFSGFTIRARLNTEAFDPRYIALLFQSPLFDRHRWREGAGTNISNLSQDVLGSFDIPFFSIGEQERIVGVLRTWGSAIEKTERLIAAKALLFKKRREDLAWGHSQSRNVLLGDLLTQSSVRVGPGRDLRVFSVTKDGLVPQDEHFNKRIANEDISRHMLVERGDFALSGLNFWLGSADVSQEPQAFCISPDYKVFKIGEDLVPGFFRHLVRTDHFRQILRSCAVERASVVRKNFDRETFLASDIPLPDRGRQEAVLAVLSAAEHELFLLRRQLDALVRQKRGLMQKLLTGEWPVKAPEPREAAE
jgi:type I restriction enzyme, S subunit